MKRWIMVLLAGCCCAFSGIGQQQSVLPFTQFLHQVRAYHPLAKQAALPLQFANAELQIARGAFDPVAGTSYSLKTLNGTHYYEHLTPELKIPLLVPNIKTGYERSGGNYVNPEAGSGVASYLGIEMPLLKNLLFDKRRAMVAQAKIYKEQSVYEQRSLMNNLLLDAAMAYGQWTASYQYVSLYKQASQLAEKRLQLVRIAFQQGDRSRADTVEAFIQWQQIQLQAIKSQLQWQLSWLQLSTFLWSQQEEPLLLAETYIPDTIAFSGRQKERDMKNLLAQFQAASNPEVQVYQFKIKSLEVERRLKRQSLLPELNLQYNLLSKGYYQFNHVNAAFFENNRKVGIEFKMPLFQRTARGELKKATLKLEENKQLLKNKMVQLDAKIAGYAAELSNTNEQWKFIEKMVQAYEMLLHTEELRFQQGESSLFMVNNRENKWLEAKEKWIDIQWKYQKADWYLRWLMGAFSWQ